MFVKEGPVTHRVQIHALFHALIQEVVRPFRWQVSVVIVMQTATQILLLASLLLPWQLLQVMMTGQSRLTGWLPAQFSDNDKIAMLLALGMLCFCAYSLLKWLIRSSLSRLFDRILNRLNKTRLVANHRLLGRRMLATVLGALSSACIVALFCLVITLLHPGFGLLAAVCVAALSIVVAHNYRFEKVPSIQEALNNNVLTVINISFALGFCLLIVDYLYGSVRPLLTLFILLIALRQMMAASVNGIVNILGVIKNFQYVNMLLLPRNRQVSILETTNFVKRFGAVALTHWLPEWLSHRHHRKTIEIIECRLLHGRTVAQVLLYSKRGDDIPSYWLLKCYVTSRENEARHEITLLQEYGGNASKERSEIPALLEHGQLSWCSYILLDVGNLRPQWLNSEARKPWMTALRGAFLQLPLSQNLVAQYRATFASLPERMSSLDLVYFDHLVLEDRKVFQIERFKVCWPNIINLVKRVPHCLTIQNPSSARLAIVNQQLLLLDWQGWSHDTLGVYWPLSAKLYSEINELLTEQWSWLQQFPAWDELHSSDFASHHVALAARAHEFCHRCRMSNDAGALNMIPGLLNAYDALIDAENTPSDSFKE
jgi:hypothetical protein